MKIFFLKILYVVRLEPTISTLTAIRYIQMAKRDSDGYRIRKSEALKSILFIMFANLKLVLRSYTRLYGIFMSACLTLYIYSLLYFEFVYICIFTETKFKARDSGVHLRGLVWAFAVT